MSELGALRGTAPLREGLRAVEPVRYREGGNRTTDGSALLQRLESLAPSLGVTRLGEISQLSPTAFPVFQSTRPNLYTHVVCGQNTGSQGKGRTPLQAKLSCLMEEVESFCAEPKQVMLVRGSYRSLSPAHVCAYPRKLTHNYQTNKAGSTQPLMWCPAYSLEHDCELLVPAEAVFFPFCAEDYDTQSFFPCSSNGLAAGASYLEATVHGLYEVMERAFVAYHELREAEVDALSIDTIESIDAAALRDGGFGACEVELEVVRFPSAAKHLPMVICYVHHLGSTYAGYGCSAHADQAVDRAISEGLQALAVNISGSREDLDHKRAAATTERKPRHEAGISMNEFRDRCDHRRFDELRAELDYLVETVHELGYLNVFVANLTRVGVDVPVVKVIVPAMPCKMAQREEVTDPLTYEKRFRHRFGLPEREAQS